MKNFLFGFLCSFLLVNNLASQKLGLQLSGGYSDFDGFTNKTTDPNDLSIYNMLAIGGRGIYGSAELQLYCKKMGVGLVYSYNNRNYDTDIFFENNNAESVSTMPIQFHSFMLQGIIEKNITKKISLQFSLSAGVSVIDSSRHTIRYPRSQPSFTANIRLLEFEQTYGFASQLGVNLNYSVASKIDLFLKMGIQGNYIPSTVKFAYDGSLLTSDLVSYGEFDLVPAWGNFGLGVRYLFFDRYDGVSY